MTPEFDFLLASVRRFFQPESAVPSNEGLDWDVVWDLASRHAVAGFLRSACHVPASASAPAGGALEAARPNLALCAELVKLADLFQSEKIDVVPLKGPVLGAALYGDKVLKVSSDLDLLVRAGDALKAKRLLESIGYRLMTVPHWPADRAYLRNVNDELAFRDARCWLKLDVHWNLLPGYFPAPMDEAELWAGVRWVPWGGTRIQTLSSEHQLIFLCAHGAKHLWARLGWICDLARLVQLDTQPDAQIDWSKVFEQTRRNSTTRMTLVGLLLADRLFGVGIPAAAAALVAADPRARMLAESVVARLRCGVPATHVATASFGVKIVERNRQRARLIAGMFVQPTEAEYRLLQIPPSLYGAYYLLRPVRLAAKHAMQLLGSRDRRALDAKNA